MAGIQRSDDCRMEIRAPERRRFVSVTESGWTGSGDELVKYATDSTQGFTLMLAGLKAFLEHNIELNLTADRYPEGCEEH